MLGWIPQCQELRPGLTTPCRRGFGLFVSFQTRLIRLNRLGNKHQVTFASHCTLAPDPNLNGWTAPRSPSKARRIRGKSPVPEAASASSAPPCPDEQETLVRAVDPDEEAALAMHDQ